MKTKTKQIEVRQIGAKSWAVFENNQEKSRFRTKQEAENWKDKGDTEAVMVSKPEEVREKFRQIKTLQDVPQRGWVLDVLNVVRRLKKTEFTNDDIYAFEGELSALHPDNRHIRDKIRQQLQVLRDTGFLVQPERGVWRVK